MDVGNHHLTCDLTLILIFKFYVLHLNHIAAYINMQIDGQTRIYSRLKIKSLHRSQAP